MQPTENPCVHNKRVLCPFLDSFQSVRCTAKRLDFTKRYIRMNYTRVMCAHNMERARVEKSHEKSEIDSIKRKN